MEETQKQTSTYVLRARALCLLFILLGFLSAPLVFPFHSNNSSSEQLFLPVSLSTFSFYMYSKALSTYAFYSIRLFVRPLFLLSTATKALSFICTSQLHSRLFYQTNTLTANCFLNRLRLHISAKHTSQLR